jgi:uncharacterized membrane protein
MASMAGSWIGGSPNQTALREIYETGPSAFAIWVAVDVIVANVWMAILLAFAANRARMDKWFKADASSVAAVQAKAEAYESAHARIPSLRDLMLVAAVGFGAMGVSHFFADLLTPFFKTQFPDAGRFSVHSSFFWLVVVATVIGVALSFTPARRLQGAGSMKIGSLLIYFLIATVGLNMNIRALVDSPGYFLIGALWMSVHAGLLILVGRIIRAPVFFLAVGSQANIGGAASAPVVAAAFHPSLAPVGVLLAILGYILGTFGGWLSGQIMQSIAGG